LKRGQSEKVDLFYFKEAHQNKLEQDKLLPSQREAWSKLNLVEMTFAKKELASG
jgi:hypothetical protein